MAVVLVVSLALMATAPDPVVSVYGTGGRDDTDNSYRAPDIGAYRWGTVGHYALLGAELYLSDGRYEGAREPAGWRPAFPGLGEGGDAGALAAGMVSLRRAAAHDAELRLALPRETRAALGSVDVEGIALGIAALREAVRGDKTPGDILYFALPPETRAALGKKTYVHDTPPWYGCFAGCPDIGPPQTEGSDYEAYLRSTLGYYTDDVITGELLDICSSASARLAEEVAWMEGDASWLRFMRDCWSWPSSTLSEATLEYMETSVSPECRGMIDEGWVVSDAGVFYPPERAGKQAQGHTTVTEGNAKPGVAGRPFDETCLPPTYPFGLPIRTDLYHPPRAPGTEHGDRAYRWGTVGHYALLGAGLYLSYDRYEQAREPAGWRPAFPGLGEGGDAGALAAGMVSLHRAAAHDAELRLALPRETRAALGSVDVEGIALGIAALREAVRGDNRPGDILYFALPPETRAALGEKIYVYSVKNFHCRIIMCNTDEFQEASFMGSDYESYLRTKRPYVYPNTFLALELRDICAEAGARLVEEVAWMESDASWLHFAQHCKYWHSGALSESVLEYMESSVSAECKEMIDGGWTVSDAGMFYPPDRPGQDWSLPATGKVTGQDGSPKGEGQPFVSTCLPHSYPLGLPFPFDRLANEALIPSMAHATGQAPPETP